MKFLVFGSQFYGLTPTDIPSGITDRPGHIRDFLVVPHTPADGSQAPALPPHRPSPRLYVMPSRTPHAVLDLAQCNSIDFARLRKESTALIDNKPVNVEFRPHSQFQGAFVNSTGDLIEYYPWWFWLDDNLRWAPMKLEMCLKLSEAKDAAKVSTSDGERDYDLVTYNQVNRITKRKRPIMHLRDDGSAVRGECMAMWGYKTEVRGAPGTATVSFALAEKLEEALDGGKSSINFELELLPGAGAVELSLRLRPGEDTHVAEQVNRTNNKYTFVRFFPTWFFLGDDCRWCGLDYSATAQLDAACGYGIAVMGDHERDYDLLRLVQRNRDSQKFRPLVQVRGQSGISPAGMLQAHQLFPEVYERADIVLKPQDMEQVKKSISNAELPKTRRILYLLHVLVRHFKFVVKGGILRDAVVKNDTRLSKDIDIEIPGGFTQAGWRDWIDVFASQLAPFGVKLDAANRVSARATCDIFGPGGARTLCEDGIITIPIVLAGNLQIDLECVTPWNAAYAPPRNVDVSVNNLRITHESTEMCLNVAFPYETTMISNKLKAATAAAASPGSFFSINQIVKQIVDGEATPCYDYKWQAFETSVANGKPAEGIRGDKWCVGYHAESAWRARIMNERFLKMREKGYKMVEEPRL